MPVGNVSVADALSATRLLLAVIFPGTVARGGLAALAIWAMAAISDYVDGPIARRRAESTAYGAVLDNVADIAFILLGLGTAAALDLISWLVPASIAVSVSSYVLASQRQRAGGGVVLARSRIGHWAGIVNYACLGIVGGRMLVDATLREPLVDLAQLVTITVNVAAVLERFAVESGARAA